MALRIEVSVIQGPRYRQRSSVCINRERYSCSAKRERGTCDSPVGIKASELEDRVLTGLKDILLGNEDLIDEFVVEFKAEVARLRKQRGANERHVQRDLNKVNTAIRRCLTFITEGDGDPGLVRNELKVLEARKRDLEQTLAANQEERAVALSEENRLSWVQGTLALCLQGL